MRIKPEMQARSSNVAMAVHRLVLLLFCLLLPIRSVGAVMVVVNLDSDAVPAATQMTCVASVVPQHPEASANDAAADVEQSGSSHHPTLTCASLCAMAAALPVVVTAHVNKPASLRLASLPPSVRHFCVPPPLEPPRSAT